MNAYRFARDLLFKLEPETAHRWVLTVLSQPGISRLIGWASQGIPATPCRVMGLEFPNPVGLAAGLDKDGECVAAWQALGFGFVEIGTVTPRPQPGNPQPRLFRLPEAQALINRMGFNNQGVERLVERLRLRQHSKPGILGINIGKNAATPLEQAVDDYRAGLQAVYPWASYVTVNISSPNTPGLRDLQYGAPLDRLLEALKIEQTRLASEQGRYVPLAVKIAPDIAETDLARVGQALVQHGMDGVIATNTTFSRAGVEHLPQAEQAGGLSGAPLRDHSTAVVARLHDIVSDRLPIIAAGGILSGADAAAKRAAGASLVQLYTGLIYRGPRLIREVVDALR